MGGIFLRKLSICSAALCASLLLAANTAYANCEIEQGSIRILSNDFNALKVVVDEARKCASGNVKVTANMTTEHKSLQVPALTIKPAEYSVAVVANNTIAPLLNADLIRPLDEYVAKYGQDLSPGQLIRIDGKVMAIAFIGNSQHLFVRGDILKKTGVNEPPRTYEELIAAAQKIREAGLMRYPVGAAYQSGWYLANEFVNLYIASGGQFFQSGSAEPAIESEAGLKTLALMKELTNYMAPEFLTVTADELKKMYLAGDVAMINQWGSMVNGHTDPKIASAEIASETLLLSTPSVNGKTPASALWWDGFTIAKNVSDADAEASFKAMIYATRPEHANNNTTAATWLTKDFNAPENANGVLQNAKLGARPYPMAPYMGLMHNALGSELADYMQGRESAEQALKDVAMSYRNAAKEAGFLN